MKENIIQIKSYSFALKIVKLVQNIQKRKNEYVLTKQLLRSATSIGANVEESIGAQSKKDFLSKILIAYKEARESDYWIRLLVDSEMIEREDADLLRKDCEEILKILGKIQSSTKENIKNS